MKTSGRHTARTMKLIAEIGPGITYGVYTRHRTVPIDYDRYEDNGGHGLILTTTALTLEPGGLP